MNTMHKITGPLAASMRCKALGYGQWGEVLYFGKRDMLRPAPRPAFSSTSWGFEVACENAERQINDQCWTANNKR